MENKINDFFDEITYEEGIEIEGGGKTRKVLQLFAGSIIIATTPVVGIGAGIVTTPVGGLATAAGYGGLGLSLFGKGLH